MQHRTIIGLVAMALVLTFSGATNAGGANVWMSTIVDCSGVGVVCAIDNIDAAELRAVYNVGNAPGGCTATTAGGFTCVQRYETQLGGDETVFAFINHPHVADGTLNIGGVIWDGLASPQAAVNGGSAVNDVADGVWKVRVQIIDDNGAKIGAFFCTDVDHNGLCGEAAGELGQTLCGTGTMFKTMDTSVVDRIVVFVDGPNFQMSDCPGTNAPLGGSTGIVQITLTPA